MKKVLKEKITTTTIHGLPKIFLSRALILKLVWFLCFVLSTAYLSIFIYDSINLYFSYNYLTLVKKVEHKIFPAVTICAFQNFAFTMKRIMFNCQFDGVQCSADEFLRTTITSRYARTYYDCYIYNSGLNTNGQKIDLKVPEKLGFGSGLKLNILLPTPTDKYFFFIHENSYKPQITDEPIAVKQTIVDRQYLFTINKSSLKKLGPPYNLCTHDFNVEYPHSRFYTDMINSGHAYTQANCFNACFDRYAEPRCNTTVGVNFRETNCYFNHLVVFNYVENCPVDVDCPLECDSTTYMVNAFDILYPSDNITGLKESIKTGLNRTVTTKQVEDLAAEINVYQFDFKFDELTEIPKVSFTELVSSVGGTMGLFLGMSLLSFVELIDFLLEMFIRFFARRI